MSRFSRGAMVYTFSNQKYANSITFLHVDQIEINELLNDISFVRLTAINKLLKLMCIDMCYHDDRNPENVDYLW